MHSPCAHYVLVFPEFHLCPPFVSSFFLGGCIYPFLQRRINKQSNPYDYLWTPKSERVTYSLNWNLLARCIFFGSPCTSVLICSILQILRWCLENNHHGLQQWNIFHWFPAFLRLTCCGTLVDALFPCCKGVILLTPRSFYLVWEQTFLVPFLSYFSKYGER